jgi:hypothetical protein
MFLPSKIRRKDGKEHRSWSVVENRRVRGGRVVQRHVSYLGEINDSQRAAWVRAIEIFDNGGGAKQIALFPEDRVAPALPCDVVSIRLRACDCAARANGADAGWRCCFGTSSAWTISGVRFCRPRARARIG